LFVNFFINYHTSVTILTVFAFISFVSLAFKKQKNFGDIFLVFVAIEFIGFLLDKSYIRLFVTPLFAMLIGICIATLIIKLSAKVHNKKAFFGLVYLVCVVLAVAAFLPQIKTLSFDIEFPTRIENYDEYWRTGQFAKSMNEDSSIITTDEQTAGIILFASSGMPGGSHNVYYYVDRDLVKPTRLSFTKIKNKFMSGDKVTRLWYLPDWIFGGEFYIGRHARYVFGRPVTDRIVQRMMEEYKEHYYVHDKSLEEPTFYKSITPIKNKIYDNPAESMWDLRQGRE
jgi:hypothetical protein